MAVRGVQSRSLLLPSILLYVTLAWLFAASVTTTCRSVGFLGAAAAARGAKAASGPHVVQRTVRTIGRASPADVSSPRRSAAIVKVEEDIEAKMLEAEEAKDNAKVTQLARLLVLAKASEGVSAWQVTEELADTVGNNIAATLAEFVGKDDYDIKDVAKQVNSKVEGAVNKLGNVYMTKEAAANAPPGSNPVILSDVMAPVADEMTEAAKESVLAFTGKDEYKFGDITKEADRRARESIAKMLGKEEYKFGDLSKAAASKAMDAVTSFTGKKDYEFGDVTKTVLRNALNFLEGDKKD